MDGSYLPIHLTTVLFLHLGLVDNRPAWVGIARTPMAPSMPGRPDSLETPAMRRNHSGYSITLDHRRVHPPSSPSRSPRGPLGGRSHRNFEPPRIHARRICTGLRSATWTVPGHPGPNRLTPNWVTTVGPWLPRGAAIRVEKRIPPRGGRRCEG